MNGHILNEDKLPPKLRVVLHPIISKQIESIIDYNRNNVEAISRWHQYLEYVKDYVSNPVIALDYLERYTKFPNGAKFIEDFNFNVGYVIKNSSKGLYVYIFKINLKPQEFNLNIPPSLGESKLPHNTIRLTESQFKIFLTECIKKIMKLFKLI